MNFGGMLPSFDVSVLVQHYRELTGPGCERVGATDLHQPGGGDDLPQHQGLHSQAARPQLVPADQNILPRSYNHCGKMSGNFLLQKATQLSPLNY